MVKEIERAGVTVVHMCTVTPISMTVGANRIVPTIAIPHPLGNPALSVLDFEKWSAAAKTLGVPLIVDNTLASPYCCRPLEHGADIVIHSTTKYSDGHATSVGGMVIDGGTFDWAASDKYPGLTQPDESYHGLVYTEAFGKAAFAAKLRSQLLRDFGAQMAPQNAWLTHLGLETLHLRMQRHCENALALAKHLEARPRSTCPRARAAC